MCRGCMVHTPLTLLRRKLGYAFSMVRKAPHEGQLGLSLRCVPRQAKQKEWPQGVTKASWIVSTQMGHCSSLADMPRGEREERDTSDGSQQKLLSPAIIDIGQAGAVCWAVGFAEARLYIKADKWV